MTKPKKIGIVLLTAGAVLVIAALLLFSHNRAEDRRAGESAEETLRLVETAMAERKTNGETGTTPAPGAAEPDAAATAANAPGAQRVPVRTLISEITGSESFIHVDFAGARWVMLEHGIHDIEPDRAIDIYLDTRHLMAFGPDGAAIAATPAAAA